MAVFQQQHALRAQDSQRHPLVCGQGVPRGQGQQEFVSRHRGHRGAGAGAGQRQQDGVQAVGLQPFDQLRGGVLAQEQAQLGERGPQAGHQGGQDEGADGRDKAEAERTAHRLARREGGLRHRFQRRDGRAGALNQFAAELGEHHVLAGIAIEDLRVQLAFQRQDAGGKGGLRHRASQRGTAEMLAFGEGHEIAELLRARHVKRSVHR